MTNTSGLSVTKKSDKSNGHVPAASAGAWLCGFVYSPITSPNFSCASRFFLSNAWA